MSKKASKKMSFFDGDNIESPEEIIDSDKDSNRKVAFNEAYKKVMQIIPEYFMKKKRKNTTANSGGTAFTQNIIVTPENVKVETNEIESKDIKEEREREE